MGQEGPRLTRDRQRWAVQSHRFRNLLLLVFAVLAVLYLVKPYPSRASAISLQDVYSGRPVVRVGKVSMLYTNDPDSPLARIYERALRTHWVHNKKHGYKMHVLREDITGCYWNKLTYLQSLIVSELAKPPQQRVEWFMWFDPDTILLNPSIPLEQFTPPRYFLRIHWIATRNSGTSVFFIHVDPWSVRLLTKAMSLDYEFDFASGVPLDEQVLTHLLKTQEFNYGTLLQPPDWYAAAQLPNSTDSLASVPTQAEPDVPAMNFEGRPGSLLIRLPRATLHADRWAQMEAWANRADAERDKWEVPFEDTDYQERTDEYWGAIRDTIVVLGKADRIAKRRGKEIPEGFGAAADMLKRAFEEASDDVESLKSLTVEMKKWFQEGAGFNGNGNA